MASGLDGIVAAEINHADPARDMVWVLGHDLPPTWSSATASKEPSPAVGWLWQVRT